MKTTFVKNFQKLGVTFKMGGPPLYLTIKVVLIIRVEYIAKFPLVFPRIVEFERFQRKTCQLWTYG